MSRPWAAFLWGAALGLLLTTAAFEVTIIMTLCWRK